MRSVGLGQIFTYRKDRATRKKKRKRKKSKNEVSSVYHMRGKVCKNPLMTTALRQNPQPETSL